MNSDDLLKHRLEAIDKKIQYVEELIAQDRMDRKAWRRQVQEVAVIFSRSSAQFKQMGIELAAIRDARGLE